MKYYQVPFSAREETPFIFGLSIREMLWLGGGFMTGLFATVLVLMLVGAKLQNMVFCLPVIIPFVCLSFYFPRKRVKADDHYETLDRLLVKKLKYNFRPHTYLNYRRRV